MGEFVLMNKALMNADANVLAFIKANEEWFEKVKKH